MNNRDEFKPTTKKILAERVAWRCSFPDCGAITIGPKMSDNQKSLNLGEAAHINAASPKGPRYDAAMSVEQRKSIDNGIWMCRAHAKFIDTDYEEYSAETLMLWKLQAEEMAYENLKSQEKYDFADTRTLICIGFDIVASCYWKSIHGSVWKFEVNYYLKGSEIQLKDYTSSFESIGVEKRFIVIESQGDARNIMEPVSLEYLKSGKTIVTLKVSEKYVATDPNSAGCDFALGEDGDISFENGDIKMVTGVEAAIQHLTTATATVYGKWWGDPTMGSFASEYYRDYKNDLLLLSRLFKLEFIRLSLVSHSKNSKGKYDIPTLHFVRRFLGVSIASSVISNSRITVEVSLEWGNGEHWSGSIPIWIDKT